MTTKAMEGLQDGRITLAWNIANFQRAKKLKELSQYFVKEKTKPVDVAAKMKSMFKAHNSKVK